MPREEALKVQEQLAVKDVQSNQITKEPSEVLKQQRPGQLQLLYVKRVFHLQSKKIH